MIKRSSRAWAGGILWLLATLPPPLQAADAQQPDLRLELNKLEAVGEACRVYLVFRNESPVSFQAFKLDLVLFGQDGVISRRLAVDAAPVKAGRTTVKLFDLAGQDCGGLGSVLVNDVLTCSDGAAEVADCVGRLAVSSRATAELVK